MNTNHYQKLKQLMSQKGFYLDTNYKNGLESWRIGVVDRDGGRSRIDSKPEDKTGGRIDYQLFGSK